MNAPQGTEAWLIERAGSATASCFDSILAKIKTGEAATRRAYRIQIVSERLSGKPMPTFQSFDMVRGNEQEPLARMAYEARTGYLAVEVGFIKHPSIAWIGCSPDGLVDDDGGVEIKCVLPHIQVETITSGGVPSKHVPQVQGGMWVTGRSWWDFVSYSPDLPGKLALYVHRVQRDESYIERLENEVQKFLTEVDEMHGSLLRMAS